MMLIFILGIITPIWIRVGPLLLMPHRIVLLLLFVPLFFMMLTGKAGRLRLFDFLMLGSSLWAALALAVNGSVLGLSVPQQIGIYMLETFGAYMLARVAVRSVDDFLYFVKLFFIAILILVPFAVLEAVTHRALLLEVIPSGPSINRNPPRWGLRRAQTVFAHPILFGTFCSVALGLFWYALRTHFGRLSGAGLAFVGTFVSLSTGALLSGVMQAVFLAWEVTMKSVPRRWTIFAVLSAIGYVAIDLLSNRTPFHVLVSYASFNSGSAYNRILIWRYGMENVWANPMFGLGADIALWSRPSWMSSSADNYWLVVTMQFGIPCFVLLAIALYMIIRKVSLAPLTDPVAQACRAGYLIALGGLILAGGTVHFWHGVMAFVMFYFGAAVWTLDAAAQGQADTSAEPEESDVMGAQGLVYTRQPVKHVRDRPVPPAPVLQRRQVRERPS